MNKKILYECEFCGKSFETKEECEEHEETHIENYSESSNGEIADELNYLREFASDYRICNKVMGMPIDSFKNLMREAVRRLNEKL